jgi:hypothetical protein
MTRRWLRALRELCAWVDCLRELVMLAMRHELEESILVDGVRVWDPHVGRPFGI